MKGVKVIAGMNGPYFFKFLSFDFSINKSHFVKTMAAIHNRREKFPFHIDQ